MSVEQINTVNVDFDSSLSETIRNEINSSSKA